MQTITVIAMCLQHPQNNIICNDTMDNGVDHDDSESQ